MYHGCTFRGMSDDPNKRTERLNIRISPAEKEKLKKGAEIDRRNLSNFIIAAAVEHAENGPKEV